jgi:hypothetical protein
MKKFNKLKIVLISVINKWNFIIKFKYIILNSIKKRIFQLWWAKLLNRSRPQASYDPSHNPNPPQLLWMVWWCINIWFESFIIKKNTSTFLQYIPLAISSACAYYLQFSFFFHPYNFLIILFTPLLILLIFFYIFFFFFFFFYN